MIPNMIYSSMPYEVVVLKPAGEFIGQLPVKLRAKALRTIDLLADFGLFLSMPHNRKLAGYELWELRVKQGSDICRLFYFHHRETVYVLTSGYVKKADRTSRREIDRAMQLKRQFLSEDTP
jgi:phage-related protein